MFILFLLVLVCSNDPLFLLFTCFFSHYLQYSMDTIVLIWLFFTLVCIMCRDGPNYASRSQGTYFQFLAILSSSCTELHLFLRCLIKVTSFLFWKYHVCFVIRRGSLEWNCMSCTTGSSFALLSFFPYFCMGKWWKDLLFLCLSSVVIFNVVTLP